MSLWNVPDVEHDPVIHLDRWQVSRLAIGEMAWDIFTGWDINNAYGRCSTPIESFEPDSASAITRSGRRYVLVSSPGYDDDAWYVFEARFGSVVPPGCRLINVSLEYWHQIQRPPVGGEHAWRGIDVTTVEAGQAGLRIFFRIASAWQLTEDQQMTLLAMERTTLRQWKAGKLQNGLGDDTRERLSHVFAIYAALQVLLPEPAQADTWLSRPNAAAEFSGRSALSKMLDGRTSDLLAVHQYLDSCLGW